MNMIALPIQPKSSVHSRPSFRMLCAWCEQTIERNNPPAGPLMGNSHGICAPCARQHFGLDLEAIAAEAQLCA
ncbi:hypothetical protein CfE428DRAFT_6302 [Chthoniobacter flavus Ellin428]|uniref:Uncharacterized protein n=1 Tax=Chthoniobacter flavus Ellin428 TaxID=497964 RepID=B4DBL1_9BACT|nr:hypothetical protein [Chthoniobacter flavus]EDY16198.1 hypothetical protein CfE428DRAFT_6302 [Chthoniobacter flavus Ellin428]TCO87198.1 hypothetical protein EV701_12335 [Chthoniobacter flavus]